MRGGLDIGCDDLPKLSLNSVYGLNFDIVSDIVSDMRETYFKEVGNILDTITAVVCDGLEDGIEWKQYVQSSMYKQGTCQMISNLFHVACNAETSAEWSKSHHHFTRMMVALGILSEQSLSLSSVSVTPSAWLGTIVSVVIQARYFTLCNNVEETTQLLSGLIADAKLQVVSGVNSLTLAYVYYSTTSNQYDAAKQSSIEKLIQSVMVTCSCMPQSISVIGAALLCILTERVVRVIGESHIAVNMILKLFVTVLNPSTSNRYVIESILMVDNVQSAKHKSNHGMVNYSAGMVNCSRRSQIFCDALVLFFLARGATYNKLLFDSW